MGLGRKVLVVPDGGLCPKGKRCAGTGGVAGPSTALLAKCASSFAQDDGVVRVLKRAVALLRDAHPNDDEAVVRMGHPDCATS